MAVDKAQFSRPVLVIDLPVDGLVVEVVPEDGEREALARIDGLSGILSLVGRFVLKPQRSGGVSVTGRVQARVIQTCTISLDPFEAEIEEDVDLLFLPEEGVSAWLAKHKPRPDDENTLEDADPPDVIVDGRIDLGQIAAEYLLLGLDPYPRKPGVAFEADRYAPEKDPSPFAALAQLTTKP